MTTADLDELGLACRELFRPERNVQQYISGQCGLEINEAALRFCQVRGV